MKRILILGLIFLFFSGLAVSIQEVPMQVGEIQVKTITIGNPLIVQDNITVEVINEQPDNSNVWIEGYNRDKRSFQIDAEDNLTLHLKIEGAMCQSNCNHEITIKATSEISQKSSQKSFFVNLTARGAEEGVGSAPGIGDYGLIFLVGAGSLILAFKNKKEN